MDRVIAGCREERVRVQEVSRCWFGAGRSEPDIVTRTETIHLSCRDHRTSRPCGYWKAWQTDRGHLKAYFDGAITVIQTTRVRGKEPVSVRSERNIYVDSRDRRGETLLEEGVAEASCLF